MRITEKGMAEVCQEVKKMGFDLSDMRALDIFARDGSWQTKYYGQRVKSLEAWEIDPSFRKKLRDNLPHARVRIVDSIREIRKKEHFGKFDFIVVDNGQNCYGKNLRYCEHFNVLPRIARLLDDQGVVVFNINKEPFNLEKAPRWEAARRKFYGRENVRKIPIAWLIAFYTRLFRQGGYQTLAAKSVKRHTYDRMDYLYYLIFYLKKNASSR